MRVLARFFLLFAFALPAYAGSVNLAWDPVPSPLVAGYAIHYGPTAGSYTSSVDVGNVTTATVPGLTEGSTYHFAVAAYDSAHAEGGLSNDVAAVIKYAAPVASFAASTVSGPAPLALNFINRSTGSITAYAWTFGDGTTSAVANPAKLYSNPGSYTVALTVTGPGGSNTSTRPGYITVTGSSDTTPPTAPASLTATATGSSTISLAWSAATDSVGVTGYRVERCQGFSCTPVTQIAAPTGTSYTDSGRPPATPYRYRVRATDAAGNLGPYSAIASATTSSTTDTTPPTAPASLTATATGSSTISLTWSAATDSVGVTGYRVERCQGASCTTFAQIATPTGTSYSDAGRAAGTTYRYRVQATDAAGNLGPYSAIASATTSSTTDTTPPTAPASLTATATGSSTISLAWSAATDSVGVTGYRVERCQGASCTTFAQIATPTGTSYSDAGRAAGTTYRYRVRATDAAGNLGGYSDVATATTVAASPAIAFVQQNYATPRTPQSSVAVVYLNAQTAGNLNVVVVGWNDTTAAITSVTDSEGNVYVRAVGPTEFPGKLSQSIYYAKDIVEAAASSSGVPNVVTVRFSVPAAFADIRVVEYSGIDRVNPVDVVAIGSGTGTLGVTSVVRTTKGNALIFAAGTVTSYQTGPGPGFAKRVITSPNGDIVEDRIVTVPQGYSASAPMSAGDWVMQLVAFRAM